MGYKKDDRDVTYTIFLDFEEHKTILAIDSKNELRNTQAGDAKGWNTSANAELGLKATVAKIKLPEQNALRCGDKVLSK
jgi:hypothetical protein